MGIVDGREMDSTLEDGEGASKGLEGVCKSSEGEEKSIPEEETTGRGLGGCCPSFAMNDSHQISHA